ncbi:FtsX-like permease family protein [bacterium A37T11]|nr:FtsX-like permease family protein [bacterium A37T11]
MAVVRDFHQQNYRSRIGPSIFMNINGELNFVHIKLAKSRREEWDKDILMIRNTWNSIYSNVPFTYKFYDETIANLYKQDRNSAKLISVATCTTIFISCLGLLGLATLTAFQRSKEIGVRKVLGANVAAIIQLLSVDFLVLMLIAVTIASPIAWWATNTWLQDFAYHITIQWWMFAVAGSGAVLIALLTVGVQAVKATHANPVNSLPDE